VDGLAEFQEQLREAPALAEWWAKLKEGNRLEMMEEARRLASPRLPLTTGRYR
jgi:hypothetical protein